MREHLLKIIVIGGLETGKTSFIRRYVNNSFSSAYKSTVRITSIEFRSFLFFKNFSRHIQIGTDIAIKKIKYNDSTIICLQIWVC